MQLLDQDHDTSCKTERDEKARQDELAALRLYRFLPREGRFQESKLLALLALLQILCQFGFLIPLQEGLIATLCRVVVAQEELQFLIPPWRTFNTLLVEVDGRQ